MRAALRTLAADEDTTVIMLISKAPHAEVAGRLAQEAARVDKPCVLAFLGSQSRFNPADSLHYAATLEHAAWVAGALVRGESVPSDPRDDLQKRLPSIAAARAKLQPQQRTIQGLYCGGTLAYEALWLLRRSLGEVASNLDATFNTTGGAGHVVLDLGAEEFTRGRPHPMIDPQLRHQQILDIARRPEVAVILCDVMLGWGAHPDPASALAAAWKAAKREAIAAGRHMICIAAVCGTNEDPQGYDRQCRILGENGIILAESNAQAIRLAAAVIGARTEAGSAGPVAERIQLKTPAPDPENGMPAVPEHLPALLASGPKVINLGLELFAAQLTACGVPVVHADWRPPAGGDTRLASLLERLR
jgi:FdrA protein